MARGSWISRALTGPSSTRTGKFSREPTGCDTRAENRDHPVLAGLDVDPMDLAAVGRQHVTCRPA